jgi:hypothetical protein
MPRRHTTNLHKHCPYRQLITWPSSRIYGLRLYAYNLRRRPVRGALPDKAPSMVAPPDVLPVDAVCPGWFTWDSAYAT